MYALATVCTAGELHAPAAIQSEQHGASAWPPLCTTCILQFCHTYTNVFCSHGIQISNMCTGSLNRQAYL